MGRKRMKKILESITPVSAPVSEPVVLEKPSTKKKRGSQILERRYQERDIPKADEGMRDNDLSTDGMKEFYRRHGIYEYLRMDGPKYIHFDYNGLLDEYSSYRDDNNENDVIRRLSYAEISKISFVNNINLALRYINYFIEFFDDDDELLMSYLLVMKDIHMIKTANMSVDDFVQLLYSSIASPSMIDKVIRMVEYNTDPNLIQKADKKYDESIQLNLEHLKAIMCVSCMHKFIIPIVSHYFTVQKTKLAKEGKTDKWVYCYIFSSIIPLFDEYYDIDLYEKLYHTATTRIAKTKNQEKKMWDRRYMFGVTAETFVNKMMYDYLKEVSQKFVFNRSAIIYLHVCFDKAIKNELIQGDPYEMSDLPMDASDNVNETLTRFDRIQMEHTFNSELDKIRSYCSNLNILQMLGENVGIDFHKLLKPDGSRESNELCAEYEYYLQNVVMPLHNTQMYLLQLYLQSKNHSGNDINMMKVPELIQLIMVMKRDLLSRNYNYMPYFICGKIDFGNGKGTMSKKPMNLITNHPLYQDFVDEYADNIGMLNMNNMLQEFKTMLSFPFEIVDFERLEYRDKIINPVDMCISDEFVRFHIEL